jgi:cleavage and polyadenylation specificity factor subunit 1
MIDRYSNWIEVVPLNSITAENCSNKFLLHWVSRYGIPDYVISDQGTQFESYIFNKIINNLGCLRKRTTPYHPSCNGKIERAHRTLKESLRSLSSKFPDWEDALPAALLAIRSAIMENGFAPCQLVFGEHLCLPSQLVDTEKIAYTENQVVDSVSSNLRIIKNILCNFKTVNQHNKTDENPGFVWLKIPNPRTGLSPKYSGPHSVMEYCYPNIIINKNGEAYKVNIDRTKPAWNLQNSNDDALAQTELPTTRENTIPVVERDLDIAVDTKVVRSRFGRPIVPVERYGFSVLV